MPETARFLTKTGPVRFKICGLTRREDALLAAGLGAFALGFVFYPPSPRATRPEHVAAIGQGLVNGLGRSAVDRLWKVGVFVNEAYDALCRTAEAAGLSHLQLHGEEPPELCARLRQAGFGVIKALRLRRAEDLDRIGQFGSPVLIDAAVPGVWGGSGQLADWDLAAQAARRTEVLLAGGLGPANALAAIDRVGPWGLDLSSGVEAAPGIKDAQKLKDFVAKVRAIHANPDRP